MAFLWVHLWDPSRQMPSCVISRNNWKQKTRCLTSTKCYVDDTLSVMTDVETASEFLKTLNTSHPSIDFTIELEENNRLPFLGMEVMKNGCRLDKKVYKKPTDSGLLYITTAHVDGRYKHSLLNTMLNHAFKLSSTWKFSHEECERLKETFMYSIKLVPDNLMQSTSHQFIDSKVSEDSQTQVSEKI